MPISLPPISRRRFLASTLAAGAGAILAGRGWAAAQEPAIDRLALLADTHIAADATAVRHNINMTDNLRAISREILAMEPKPSAMMVAGDLAFSRGYSEDYRAFVELVRPLRAAGVPVHLAMGNHDNRERFREILEKDPARQEIALDHEVLLIERPNADWIILDSLQETKVTPGLLGAAQLAWLARTLDARSKEKPVIVLVHHHPHHMSTSYRALTHAASNPASAPATTAPLFNGLLDTDALFDVILPRRQVKLLLFGHTHRWLRGSLDGLHMVNLPTSAYVFTPDQPSGWVDCRVAKRGALLRINCLNEKHALHGLEARLEWRV
jgi:3',5'-cyclic-AMP phosphodiesterase